MRTAYVIAIASCLVAPVRGRTMPDETELDNYLSELSTHNAAYRAANQEVEAARAAVDVAFALPDPGLSAGYYAQEVETRVGPQQYRLAIDQQLPWPGKRRLRAGEAEARVAAAEARKQAVLLDLVTRFKARYADFFYIGRSIDITRDHLALLESMAEVVTARYQTSTASYNDLLRIQLEIDAMTDRLRTQQATAPALIEEMNALLGRSTGASLPFPETLAELPSLQAEDQAFWSRRLQERNPTLQSLDHQGEVERVALRLAERARLPDFQIGLEWIQTGGAVLPIPDSGKDPLVLKVGMNLPLWRKKNHGRESMAAARSAETDARREDALLNLKARLAQAVFLYDDAGRKLSLYRDQIIPKAQESLEVTLAAFQTGDAGYLDLIDAEKGLLAFLLSQCRAEADRLKAAAAIEAAIGEPPFLKSELSENGRR